jgi:hypothetical protein
MWEFFLRNHHEIQECLVAMIRSAMVEIIHIDGSQQSGPGADGSGGHRAEGRTELGCIM